MCIALAFYTVTGIIYSDRVLAILLFKGLAGLAIPGRLKSSGESDSTPRFI
jgi:hypothetical protein